MSRFQLRSHLAIATVLLSIWLCPQAEAVEIPLSSLLGPVPSSPGDGLNGTFFDAGVSIPDLSTADTVVAGGSPTATFHSTLLDYQPGVINSISDNNTLATFLGADASSLVPSSVGTTSTLNTSVFLFEGFIRIDESFDNDTSDADIDVNFRIGSDDGFRLVIGGVEVSSFAGLRVFGFSSSTAEFQSAGVYSFSLLYYENMGVTGIEAFSSIPGGPGSGAPTGSVGILPTDILYRTLPTVIPEPSSLLMAGVGILGIVGLRLRLSRD